MRNCVPAVAFAIGFVFVIGCDDSEGGLSSGSGVEIVEVESVTIGSQVWMKKNLNVDVAGSRCYDNEPANCEIYGRLYTWATAMALPIECDTRECFREIKAKHQGICPSGWHIPGSEEWDVLYKFVDSSYVVYGDSGETAGARLKAKSGWSEGGNGEDSYGFAALPSGYGDSEGGFGNVGRFGVWWSATERGMGFASYRGMNYLNGFAKRDSYVKVFLQAIRCVRD